MSEQRCENCQNCTHLVWKGTQNAVGGSAECSVAGITFHLGGKPNHVSCDHFTPKEPECEYCRDRRYFTNVSFTAPGGPTYQFASMPCYWCHNPGYSVPPTHTEDEWFALYGRFIHKYFPALGFENRSVEWRYWNIDKRFGEGERSEQLWNDMTKAVQG
jgi:hypothetical protein